MNAERSLRERVAELTGLLAERDEEIRLLRGECLPEVVRYRGICLTRAEKITVAALLATDRVCTFDYLLNRRPSDMGHLPTSISVLIHRIRNKFKAVTPPIMIETEVGMGYYMTPANKALLRERKEAT